MRICLCYIAVTHGPIVDDYAARFVVTYMQYPPLVEHDLIVIANGGPLHTSTALIFEPLQARMLPRTNDAGWDVTAYIETAKGACREYDMMLCLGESNYFHREGWLQRLVEAWEKFGPGMYSPYSSNAVRAHMNTTAFCCPPMLLRQYPRRVYDRASRYEFEHGQRSLWRIAHMRGLPARMVTWDGEWEPQEWRTPPNILWRGDQSNLLMWCNHADAYANADGRTKAAWSAKADAPFQ